MLNNFSGKISRRLYKIENRITKIHDRLLKRTPEYKEVEKELRINENKYTDINLTSILDDLKKDIEEKLNELII